MVQMRALQSNDDVDTVYYLLFEEQPTRENWVSVN